MPDGEEMREELRSIGLRRERLKEEGVDLQRATEAAVRRAIGLVPMTEVAKLVGLDRTGLYKTYGITSYGGSI